MAYYKLPIQVWSDWDPAESDLEEIGRHAVLGENAICTCGKLSPSWIVHRTSRTRQR